jgi:hypothetical protein
VVKTVLKPQEKGFFLFFSKILAELNHQKNFDVKKWLNRANTKIPVLLIDEL